MKRPFVWTWTLDGSWGARQLPVPPIDRYLYLNDKKWPWWKELPLLNLMGFYGS